MNFRPLAGILLILATVLVIPVAALPDLPAFTGEPDGIRTGTVWVTFKDINGSATGGVSGPVNIAYAVGEVAEINPAFVYEDAVSGTVTVTMNGSVPVHPYTLALRKDSEASVYVINSIAVAEESEPLLTNSQSFSVVPATANYYADTVPEGKQHEWVDLDWKDPGRDLGLMVYAPDATFGPYSDTSDGRKDGRIFLDFSSLLNVTAGNWFFRVQNTNHEFTPYTLNTYSA